MRKTITHIQHIYRLRPEFLRLARFSVTEFIRIARQQKGKILLILFHFFVVLADGLIVLIRQIPRSCGPYPGFSMPLKYAGRGQSIAVSVRYWLQFGVLATAWLLFMLSSFEWTVPGNGLPGTAEPAEAMVTGYFPSASPKKHDAFTAVYSFPGSGYSGSHYLGKSFEQFSHAKPYTGIDRYLRIRALRI